MLWIVLAAMTAVALALIVAPLWRRSGTPADRAAHDVEVYRDQLEELDRDLERGLIDANDADAARAEIGRRLLAADAETKRSDDPASGTRSRAWITGGLALAVPAMAVGIYLSLGAPGLPGSPAAERQAAAPDRSSQRAAMIARLGERLRQSPDDAEAWSNLGILLMSARRYTAAAEALGRASELTPGSAGLKARLGEAFALAADGVVGEKARKMFESALAIDAREPRARFYLGMAEYQAGRRQAALRRWRALEAETPADAPWRAPLRAQISRLAAELGEAPGPTAGDIEAASRMSGDDRQVMIRSMVARLAERLAETPNDADGWIRLARSYKVLGEAAKSRAAHAKAAALRPDDVAVLTGYASSIASAAGADATEQPEFNDVITRLLGLDPDNPTALWFAGLTARQSGDGAAARRHWRRLLALLDAESDEHAELSRQLGELEAGP